MSVSTNVTAVLLPGFAGPVLPEWVARRLREGLAGVCIFGSNIETGEQFRALVQQIREANPRAVIAVDEEGGDVTRLYFDRGAPTPGNAVLGRIDEEEATESAARVIGEELRAIGVNLDFAPDVDINSNPLNPVIGVRSFGAEPARVARHSAAWVRGLQSTGVAASIKHFPGHGDTAQDSHLALPVVDLPLAELRERELLPFRAAIAAGAATVMTSHILLPQLDAEQPATFSRAILQELLRGELGFTGAIVSDALDMKGASGVIGIPQAAVRALDGGCDLLCIGPDTAEELFAEIVQRLESSLADGSLAEGRLVDAARRVAVLQDAYPMTVGERSTGPSGGAEPGDAVEAGPDDAGLALVRRALHRGAGLELSAPRHWVRLQTVPSIAVGPVPWGVFAAGADASLVLDGPPREEQHAALEELLAAPGTVLLVGRDNHRHAWVRELIDGLRPRGIVAVDMGWPDLERGYADLATFGASRLLGAALLAALDEPDSPEPPGGAS